MDLSIVVEFTRLDLFVLYFTFGSILSIIGMGIFLIIRGPK